LAFASCLLVLLVAPVAARAEVDGNQLKVSLVTFGPGEHPFFKFGHNAILIEHQLGQGIVYNFGMFDFSSPALIPKFILGRSEYWLGRSERDRTMESYIADDRSIEIQELDLTAAERAALFERLEENARPQNRNYLYDYFTDNCSTRVRDALDAAIGGRLKAASTGPARLSYRGHALRLVGDLAWEYVALSYALGLPADRRATRWEESFIPMELRDVARTVRVPGEAGQDRPLVKSERTVYRSTRPDPPLQPPRRMLGFALTGLILGGLALGLGVVGRRARAARVALGIVSAIVGFVAGLGGLLLIFLWVATNHRAAHANANIMQSVPWAIALLVLGIQVALGRRPAAQRAFTVTAAAAATSLFGLGARITTLLPQDNAIYVALFLPVWLGFALGFHALLRGETLRASRSKAG
jgi:hypothetical protein